jgi:glycosyltransferase involved in cell wall biosynthesis
MAGQASGVDLIVVVNGFPRVSETFVLQELLELERRGARLQVVALRRPEEIVLQEALDELRADVTYLPDLLELGGRSVRLAVRAAHAALLVRRPRTYLDGLACAAMSPDVSRASLQRSVLLAHLALRLGSPPLYAHFAHKPGTIARAAALLAGVQYALSAHAKDVWLTPPSELSRKVRDAELVLTCSDEGRSHLEQLSSGRTPVRLIHHGVGVGLPRRHPLSNPVPVIVSVGRLVPKKGYATLLLAAASLRRRGVACRLRIAGEGPEWAILQRLAHSLAIVDCVTFLGPLTPGEVNEELRRADIFALACEQTPDGDRDGIPNVILEAMARGLPVASTTLAGVSEAVRDGETGLLARPGNPEELADRLELLLADPALRARLGGNGQRRAEAYFDRDQTLPRIAAELSAAGLLPSSVANAGLPHREPLRLAS